MGTRFSGLALLKFSVSIAVLLPLFIAASNSLTESSFEALDFSVSTVHWGAGLNFFRSDTCFFRRCSIKQGDGDCGG